MSLFIHEIRQKVLNIALEQDLKIFLHIQINKTIKI